MRCDKVTWSISLEAKSQRNVVKMKEEMAALFVSGSVVVCCHCEWSKVILVEIFGDKCCLVDNVSTNCQTNTLARSIYPRLALRSLDGRRGHAKKVGNIFSFYVVQLGTTRNYIAVKEEFLGFVLVYELVCTEMHGSGSFVKRVDPFCAVNRHDWFCSTAWLTPLNFFAWFNLNAT